MNEEDTITEDEIINMIRVGLSMLDYDTAIDICSNEVMYRQRAYGQMLKDRQSLTAIEGGLASGEVVQFNGPDDPV